MEQRYEVARMLDRGMIYSSILPEPSASFETISRVNRSLNYGSDGYDMVFARLNQEQGE